MLPSAVLTQVNGVHLAAFGPEPVSIGKWSQPASVTAVQQDRPSLTTLLPATRSRLASRSISFLRKPLTTVSRSRLGLRSAVVSTAADEWRLAGRTAPALAARTLPAEIGVVHLHPAPELGLLCLACFHRRHQLVLDQPSCRLAGAEPARELD